MSDLITRLGDFGSPTIPNALEILGEDPDHGFTDGTLRMLTAEGAVFVGRALTATMVSAGPLAVAGRGGRHRGLLEIPRASPTRAPNIVVVPVPPPDPAGTTMYGEVRVARAASVARRRRDRDQRCGARPDRADPDRLPIDRLEAGRLARACPLRRDRRAGHRGRRRGQPGRPRACRPPRRPVDPSPYRSCRARPGRAAEIEAREAELFAAADLLGALASTVPVDLADVHGRWPERNDGSPEGPPGIPPP